MTDKLQHPTSLTPIDWQKMMAEEAPAIIRRALAEDLNVDEQEIQDRPVAHAGDNRTRPGGRLTGDITSVSTIPPHLAYTGTMLVKAPGVIAGLEIARQTFHMVDPAIEFIPLVEDGAPVQPGDIIANVSGPARSLLTAERVALNFLQRMSGIATLTRRYVDAVAGTNAVILDTRKTMPGLRLLDKWAVVQGGGTNHRIGLYDMALIKDNHIVAAGGIRAAVEGVRAHAMEVSIEVPIEVEVTNLEQLHEAMALGVDQIMLDNMTPDEMRAAVQIVDGAIPLEASGNVSLETVAAIAATRVDYISVGKLTHSVTALDISFNLAGAGIESHMR